MPPTGTDRADTGASPLEGECGGGEAPARGGEAPGIGGQHRAGTREHSSGEPTLPAAPLRHGWREEEEEKESWFGAGRSEIKAGPAHTVGGGRVLVLSFPVPSCTPMAAHGAGVRTRLRTGHVRMFRLLCRAQRSFRGKIVHIYKYSWMPPLYIRRYMCKRPNI